MPFKPLHQCSASGCPGLTRGRFCTKHEELDKKKARQYDKERDQTEERHFIHSTQWRAIREGKLARDPLCQRHLMKSQDVPAIIVHHRDRNEFNNIEENLESLCSECHEVEHKGERWGK